METFKSFVPKLHLVNEKTFTDIALEIFHFQAINNPVYKSFITHLGKSSSNVATLGEIPFLPISFFKSHVITAGNWAAETTFTSSGTTSSHPSTHAVANLQFYLDHSLRCFEHFFGPVTQYHFLALLPSYLERTGSSLTAMIEHFIKQSKSRYSAFYLNDVKALIATANVLKEDPRKTIVWGVSFALLDLAEQFAPDLSHCLVFETGGMKGRRKEITRNELWDILKDKINVKTLYSEYGMTELLSQSYSGQEGLRFRCPPWMRVLCRDLTEPLRMGLLSETGGINVIDLANWQTLSFIETEDLGKVYTDGSFEVLGRLDNSDLRGCNLMIE